MKSTEDMLEEARNPAPAYMYKDGTGTYYTEDFNEILECVGIESWTRRAKMQPFTFIPAALMYHTVN